MNRSRWSERFDKSRNAPDSLDDDNDFTIGRLFMRVAMVALPIILLVGIASGFLYVRLLHGPVSLDFLKGPIEESISAELPGFTVSIGQPVIALRDHGLELRLTDVRLADDSGKPVAFAPLAAVELSRRALLAARISPSQIVLIEPRLRVFYSANDGVSLTIDTVRQARADKAANSVLRPGIWRTDNQASAPETSPRAASGRIDLAQTIAGLAERARSQENSASYLDRIGLRNATVILDRGDIRTALRVSAANFDLMHSDTGSVLSGNVAVASRRGTWRIGLRVEDAQDKSQVRLSAAVKDLYPQSISDALPEFEVLSQFRFPISAKADYLLSSEGQILAGIFDVALGAGEIQIPSLGDNLPSLNSGRARLVYHRGRNHIDVETATLRWSQSNLELNGLIKHRKINSSVTGWDFQLQSTDGHFATTGNGAFVKLKRWNATGTLLPAQGIVNLEQVLVEAGDDSLVLDGIIYTGQSPGYNINGRFSPMAAQNILAYWPTYAAVGARKWVVNNVLAGQLLGGTFAMRLRAPSEADNKVKSDYALKIDADLANVRFSINEKLPSVYASKAAVTFNDDVFSARLPQSALLLGDDRSILISDLSFEIKDIRAASVDGRATFKFDGKVDETLDIVRQLDIGDAGILAGIHERFAGKVNGNLEITVPLVRPGDAPPPKVAGQISIVDGRAKDVWKNLDVEGSNILLDIVDKTLIARGDILVEGIPVKIGWRQNLDSGRNASPLTLQVTLDDADRNSLGLDINHIVKGPIEVNATVAALPGNLGKGRALAHVRIDLTTAALQIESLALNKTIGRKTFADFDIESDQQSGWRLTNLRIDGDKVAARGEVQIDAQGGLAAFDISDFAVDVVTRLKIKGELRQGNVWRVSVRGKAFEGRSFFRALFSPSRPSDGSASSAGPALDLDVRIDNVLGYWDTALRDLKLDLSRRNGKMTALSAYGKFDGKGHLRASVKQQNNARQLVITSNNAGQTFNLVGFYPNIRKGQLKSIIEFDNMDADGRRGLLVVRRFNLLGDQIVSEVLNKRSQLGARNADTDAGREVIQFDWMQIPFVVGSGRFVMRDAELRGPLLGALLCGKADFEKREMQVAGTYIPLQGLSAVVGSIPGIGNLLAGPRGEGIIGINFEVRGAMERPQVIINPLSAVTPGIFREVFQVACPDSRFLSRNAIEKSEPQKQPRIDKGWAYETFRSSN